MTFAVLTWLVLGVTTLSLSDAGLCPTCNYVRSSDPSVGYECVDDVYASPHTQNISCDFSTHSCWILVDYNTPDYTVLRSLSRKCQAGSPKNVSCNSNTPAQCTFACRSDHCNTQDGDLGRYFRGSDAGLCPTCSYVRSSDPSVGYECVDDVYASPYTQNISCDFSTHSCWILVDYNTPDYTVLRSLSRKCQAGSPKNASCNSNTPAQCTFACRSDHCNTQDGDLGRYFRGSGSTGDNSDAGLCPTCSYVRSSDPSVGYECVDDVYASPHTQNISCDFSTHSCWILVDYNTPDYTVLRSLSRKCQAGSPKGASCNSNTPAQCTFACRSDHCNTQDGDLGRYFRGSGSTGDNSGGRNGSGVVSLGLCLLLVAAWRRHLGL